MLHMTPAQMPGPTETAKQLQFQQICIRSAYYSALSAHSHDANYDAPDVVDLRNLYDGYVVALREELGPDAHCAQVDSDLWSQFSDWMKDESGFRPRGHYTYQDVQNRLSSAFTEIA